MRRSWAVVALVAWTFVVWTTRIAIVAGDDELDTGGKVGRVALALAFTALALAVVVALWRRLAWLGRVVSALAVWTIVVWLLRGVPILLGDHAVGFKVVHTILAVVSVALSVLAERSVLPVATPEPDRR